MSYALKVDTCNSLVKSYYVDLHYNYNCAHIDFTDKPEMALTFDVVKEAFAAALRLESIFGERFRIVAVKNVYKEL